MLRKASMPKDVVEKEIKNAERHLTNARRCVEQKMYDLAMVAIYMSMFHAARAVLFKDGLKERSHICIILYIEEKYPDLRRFARLMDGYRRSRHTVLYGIEDEAVEKDAKQGLEGGRDLIDAIKKVCGLPSSGKGAGPSNRKG